MNKVLFVLLVSLASTSFSQSIDYKFLEQLFEQREYSKCLNRSEKILEKGTEDPLPFFFKALSLSNLLTDKKISANYIDPYRECLDFIASAKNFSNGDELFSAYKKELDKFQRKIVSYAQRLARKGMENEAEVYLKNLKQVFDGTAPFEFVLELDVQNLYLEQINTYVSNDDYEKVNEMIEKLIAFSGEKALEAHAPVLAETFKEKAMALFSAGNIKSAENVFDNYARFSSIATGNYNAEFKVSPEFPVWSQSDLDKANTAANEYYLSELEKGVVFYINLARMYPDLFRETYLDNYVKSLYEDDNKIFVSNRQYDYNTLIKSEYYYSSLYKTLKKQKALNSLIPDKHLYLYALCWAKESGTLGVIGHNRKNCTKGNFAECCQYGYDEALMIVLDLLIDEGIPSFGHRNIILGEYTKVGVSYMPHTKYDVNTVIDFY